MKRLLSSVIGLVLITFTACEEENLSLPTPVNLTLIAEPLQTLNGDLLVDKLEINISKLEIEGSRDAGGDVLLERNFDEGSGSINLRSQLNNKISFDIPQGAYNNLRFLLNFKSDEEEREEISEDIVEWIEDKDENSDEEIAEDLGEIIEEYLEDVNPALLFTATADKNGRSFKIVMPLNDPIIFDVPFTNIEGGRNISLIKDQGQELELVFNPDYWFSITSFEALNDAQKGTIEGEEYVFLHKQINSSLYSLIVGRIEESTVVRTK